MEREPTFMSASSVAARLGLPKTWVKSEAEAGRIPCVRAAGRMLFSVAMVERALTERAGADKPEAANAG
jgi:hypothetical protein